jgi:hypothetical protein
MIRAAVAVTRAEIIRGSLARRAVLAVFTVISFSGAPSVRSVALEWALKKAPCSDCATEHRRLGIRSATAPG